MSKKQSGEVCNNDLRASQDNNDLGSSEELPFFLEYATELAKALRNTIFIDQVRELNHELPMA